MGRLAAFTGFLCALLAAAPLQAEDVGPSRYGFAGGAFASSFIGGDSGPTTPLSDTRYSDTFGTGYQPYVLGNLGLVYLSELSVVSGGSTIPYWAGNWRDYLELGVGVARRTGGGTWTLDVRLQTFGAPESATWPIGEATAGTSLLFGVGYEWERQR
jgi:hypothetical protein